MENLQRNHSIIIVAVFIFVLIHSALSQRYLSGSGSASSPEECGVQDKDELPDMHAAAPWAAALFYVEGDIFQNQLKPQYLNTAIFISKNVAIVSGSKTLAQAERNANLHTNLQLYYGHRASGKQTLIRISKVEALYPPKQPLALRVDTSTSARIQNQQQFGTLSGQSQTQRSTQVQKSSSSSSTEPAELYLLHLESSIESTSFNRPLCVNGDIFKHKQEYFGDSRRSSSSSNVHLSGYASKNETGVTHHVVYFTADREWKVNSWESDYITLKMPENQVSFGYLPKHFNPGSALTVKLNDRYYLAGILLRSSETLTTVRSIEKLADMIQSKNTYMHPVSPEVEYFSSPTDSLDRPSSYDSLHNPNPEGVQKSFLEKVEEKEKLESLHPTQISQTSASYINPNLRTSSRPVNGYSESIRSPDYNPYQRQPVNPPIQSGTRVTEQLNPYPPISSTTSQPIRVHNPSKLQMSPYYQHQTKCSYDYKEGVDIECLSRGVSPTDCIQNASPNTKIRLSCKLHYVPLDNSDKLIEKTCDSSGNWLPRKTFGCTLDCGNVDRSVPYIVHGSKTASEKWPWHAALFKKVNDTTFSYICGATLISRSFLITAAHCVYNSAVETTPSMRRFKVVVGAISSDLLSNRKDQQAQEFNIERIIVNEHYNPKTFEGDIALIQIEKPVVLTEYVRPVCFPFPSDENKQVSSYQLSEGNHGVVVGFGTTEDWSISRTLRMATLPVVSVKDCTTVLERLPSSSQYCAGYTNGTSVCEGDSGGAQIFKDQISKRFYVQGIISHGNRRDTGAVNSRCDHEKYTVFTKVGSFAEWVKKTVYDLDFDYNRRRRK